MNIVAFHDVLLHFIVIFRDVQFIVTFHDVPYPSWSLSTTYRTLHRRFPWCIFALHRHFPWCTLPFIIAFRISLPFIVTFYDVPFPFIVTFHDVSLPLIVTFCDVPYLTFIVTFHDVSLPFIVTFHCMWVRYSSSSLSTPLPFPPQAVSRWSRTLRGQI